VTTDPDTIAAILAGLESGRQKAIAAKQARGAATERAVRRELDVDLMERRPARGRPGRVARRLAREGVKISERQVRRIIAALSVCPIQRG
jgi:hypothetical protein